jgi:hypothetical protein
MKTQSGWPDAQLKFSENEDIDIPVLLAKTPRNQIPSTILSVELHATTNFPTLNAGLSHTSGIVMGECGVLTEC